MFGSAQLKRVGVKGARRIAASMRLLARLLKCLHTTVEPRKTLSHFLNGTYFDAVVECVEHLSGLHNDEHGQRVFKRPSLPLLIGNSLQKCCQIKKGIAIRAHDELSIKEVQRFISLYEADWSNSVSCPALATLKKASYNKAEELPSTSDLLKLKDYTENQLNQLTTQLESDPQYGTWRSLSEIVLIRLLIFNKRRASEPAKLEVSQYVNRPNWCAASNKELLDNLKPLERKLMERMDLIQIPGKRNKKVPLLITPQVGTAMKLLVKTRSRCGIMPENKYFFATDSSNGYLNTWLVLHNHAVAAGVQKPRLITSCRLRKYVATIAQLADLRESEREWLAEHLGHTLGVHKSHYRQQEPIVEMAQLSRLSIAVEGGQASAFVGKKLSDINAVGNFFPENGNSDVESDDCDQPQQDELDLTLQRCVGFPNVMNQPMVGNLAVANDEIVQPMNNDEIIQAPKTKKSLVLRKRRLVSASEDELGERRAWSKTELEALRNAFQNHRQPPKFGEIEELLASCPMLKSRTPAQIKTRAWALIQKLSNN